ncbi:MAG: beta-N-acetylhexosaminidase [Lentisphaeria bacterium]|nr:beta-N-acetylhexosaminidase [Lentisphaeria bacterium]
MHCNTLASLIPAPLNVTASGTKFPLRRTETIAYPPEAAVAVAKLRYAFAELRVEVTEAADAAIRLHTAPSLPESAWEMRITPEKIVISASGAPGFSHGAGALIQMATVAAREGLQGAYLDCGTVEDAPRFPWRGFLLDSARHFQSAETVKQVIRLLAEFRINSFHWHLTDNDSWRIESKHLPALAGKGRRDDGFYTRRDLREVTELARELGVRIIPEVDVPGHSEALLAARPDLACDSQNPGREFCLGNPDGKRLIRRLFDELMEFFPDSPVIHLGGDEADTAHWEQCPRCQQAMREQNCAAPRELENAFMADLVRYVAAKGRTPMLWGTCSGQKYPPEAIMQAWLDIREPLRIAKDGNKVVYSIHTSLYFDYPSDLSEPLENWMFQLSEQGVYMTDPYVIWEEQLKDVILGPEACLWTETVPEWRVLRKILSRLPAYAECAWSRPDRKDYYDFIRRRDQLKSAGYFELLRKLSAASWSQLR